MIDKKQRELIKKYKIFCIGCNKPCNWFRNKKCQKEKRELLKQIKNL